MFELPACPAPPVGVINLSDMMKGVRRPHARPRRVTVAAAREPLIAEEADKLLDQDR